MRVIHCKVGEPPKFLDVNNDLDSLQKLVGGYLEQVPKPMGMRNRIVVLANEEGLLRELPFNRVVWETPIVGDFVITAADGPEFTDLTAGDLKAVVKTLGLRLQN